MKVKREKIDIVRSYICGNETIETVLEVLTPDILKVPRIFKNYDSDISQGFFEYIAKRLSRMILYYKSVKDVSFESWLYLILKRKYFDFIKRKQSFNNKIPSVIDYSTCENFISLCSRDVYDLDENEKHQIDTKHLTDNERKIVALKYGYGLNTEQENLFNNEIHKSKIRFRSVEDKLAEKYFALINLDNKILNESDPEIRKNLIEKRKILIDKKRSIETEMKSVRISTTNRWVASHLNLTPGTVSGYVFRIRNKLNGASIKMGAN